MTNDAPRLGYVKNRKTGKRHLAVNGTVLCTHYTAESTPFPFRNKHQRYQIYRKGCEDCLELLRDEYPVLYATVKIQREAEPA